MLVNFLHMLVHQQTRKKVFQLLEGDFLNHVMDLARNRYIDHYASKEDELRSRLDSLLENKKTKCDELEESELVSFLISWSINRDGNVTQVVTPRAAKLHIETLRRILTEQHNICPDLTFPSLGRWEKGWISGIITNKKFQMRQANQFPSLMVERYVRLMNEDIQKWKLQDQKTSQFRVKLYYALLMKTSWLISYATGSNMGEVLAKKWSELSFFVTEGQRGLLLRSDTGKGEKINGLSCFTTEDEICPVQAVTLWMKFQGITVSQNGIFAGFKQDDLIFPMFRTVRSALKTDQFTVKMKRFELTHSLDYKYSAHAGRTVLGAGIALTTYRNKLLVFKDMRILANFNFKINEEGLTRYTKSISEFLMIGFTSKGALTRKKSRNNPEELRELKEKVDDE